MAVKVEGIELQIAAESGKAVGALNELTKSLGALKETVTGGLIPSSAINSIKRLGEAVSKVNIVMLADIAESLQKIKDAAAGITGTSVKINIPKNITVPSVNEAKPADITTSPAVSETAEELKDAADAAKQAYPEFTRDKDAIKGLGKEAKKSSLSIEKLGAAFKRIVIYRAIRAIIKEITQAFAEGKNNAYQYSKSVSGPLAKSLDALATSALFLKNGLGAAMAPIINAFTPVVAALTDTIAELGNTIAGVIAMLTGQSTYIKAIKNMTEYADATKGAAKAQRQLLGFDELNVLSDRGGSGGTAVDYSKMFETVNTKDFVNDFSKSFAELPKIISGKIKDALEKIAELISSVNWFEIPGKIADKLKVAFENFDFKGVFTGIGKLIGSTIVGAISFTVGALWAVFKGYINDEFAGLDDDATIFQKGWAVAKGIFRGILEGFGNIVGWIKDNIVAPFWQGLKTGLLDTVFEQFPLQMKWKVATKWAEFKHWFKDTIGAVFTAQFWQDKWANIWNGLTTVIEWIKVTWNNLRNWFKDNPIKTAINRTDNISIGGFGGSITAFAQGGYPATGSMFMAGETGPELVTQVGNKTGVINNDTFGAIVSTAAENIINAILASGQATAEAAREGGNTYIDGTLVSRQLYGKFQNEGVRKGGSAVQFVGV